MLRWEDKESVMLSGVLQRGHIPEKVDCPERLFACILDILS